MSEQDHNPKRLLDGLAPGDGFRALIEAGKSEVPSDQQLMLLAAKIGIAAGAAGVAGAGTGTGAGAGAGAGGVAGAGTGAGAGAGAGAGGVAAGAGVVKTALAMKVVVALAIAGAVGGGVAAVEHARAPVQGVSVRVVASEPAALAVVPSASAARAPLDEPSSVESSASASGAPRAMVATSASALGGAALERPDAEVKLLERAQDALRSNPSEAYALCTDHARRFPRGMLVQEREIIAIEALVKTGRMDDARTRADRFRVRFPGSSHSRRIDALLAP